MPVGFYNFEYSFLGPKGKPIFVPNTKSRIIGDKLKSELEAAIKFEGFYFHLKRGGHVAALHEHRPQRYFARVDIERFFYSIGRNRIARTLRDVGLSKVVHFAKWSTVRTPYPGSGLSYVLPYGFPQSPILATAVLRGSSVGAFLKAIPPAVSVSVYVDDIALSSDDWPALEDAYAGLQDALLKAGFTLSSSKCTPPTDEIALFNCSLKQDVAEVTADRKALFYGEAHSGPSVDGFERYCASVRSGNA